MDVLVVLQREAVWEAPAHTETRHIIIATNAMKRCLLKIYMR
jgi:hypothetical protein